MSERVKGWGVVGWGARCPKCDKVEQFINYWSGEWECPKCKARFNIDDPEASDDQ